jgi:hypothetical protein
VLLHSAPEAARPFIERASKAAEDGDSITALRPLNRAQMKALGQTKDLVNRADTCLTLAPWRSRRGDG